MAKRIQRKVSAPRESGAAKPSHQKPAKATGRRVGQQVVTDFTLQLATLTSAGIPLVRALSILHGQAQKGPFKDTLGDVTEDVAAGTPLSEALAKHSRAFDPLYSSMVRAGETGGLLDTILERLAALRERAATVASKIKSAMLYPAVILVVAIAVVGFVVAFVIPRFQSIFETFDVELPRSTRTLLATAEFSGTYWYLVVGVPILLLVLHLVLYRSAMGYKRFVHRLLFGTPLLGSVLRQGEIVGFARTFGTLIQAGVPHLDALGITRDTTNNLLMSEAIDEIRGSVREGEGIASPMEESQAFDDLVCNMVEVGEETGELDSMLIKVADAYEVQVDRKMDNLFKVLEPALLIAMAGFVGFVVVALFLPLLSIMDSMKAA